jgi:hypothetical protein
MRRLRMRLGMRLIWHLPLRLLRLHPGLLAGLVFAAAATAPMPMRLRLTVVRCWPLFRLGQGWFYCHDAYASWCFALCALSCAIYDWFNFSISNPRFQLVDDLVGDPAHKLSGFSRKATRLKP